MSQEFKQINEWITRVNNNLFEGYNCFIIWDSMQKLMGADIIGESEAEKNVEIINQFHYFFIPTIEANKKTFSIELYKVFDTNRNTISLRKIINFVRSNIGKFSVADFEEHYKDRELIEHLVTVYKPITEKTLKECENELDKVDILVEKLRKFRHATAHNHTITDEIRMTVAEVEEIFTVASKIINKLSLVINRNINQPFHGKDSIEHETNLVIEHLKRFEPYRLKEIEEKYHVNIE